MVPQALSSKHQGKEEKQNTINHRKEQEFKVTNFSKISKRSNLE